MRQEYKKLQRGLECFSTPTPFFCTYDQFTHSALPRAKLHKMQCKTTCQKTSRFLQLRTQLILRQLRVGCGKRKCSGSQTEPLTLPGSSITCDNLISTNHKQVVDLYSALAIDSLLCRMIL